MLKKGDQTSMNHIDTQCQYMYFVINILIYSFDMNSFICRFL